MTEQGRTTEMGDLRAANHVRSRPPGYLFGFVAAELSADQGTTKSAFELFQAVPSSMVTLARPGGKEQPGKHSPHAAEVMPAYCLNRPSEVYRRLYFGCVGSGSSRFPFIVGKREHAGVDVLSLLKE